MVLGKALKEKLAMRKNDIRDQDSTGRNDS